ncbi:hypothetical protein IAT38_005979 [Cryptococcus sp. DSM 104549]
MDHAPPTVSRPTRCSTYMEDLYSLSFDPAPDMSISTNHSFASLEYPRAEPPAPRNTSHHPRVPSGLSSWGARTPGTQGGEEKKRSEEKSMFVGASPASTAGHHASAVTLGARVFAKGGREDAEGEYDPERNVGKLVGELGRVTSGGNIPSRPTSPYSPYRSPTPINNVPPTNFFVIQPGKPPDLTRAESSQFSALSRNIETKLRAANTANAAPGGTQAQPKGKGGKPKSRPHTLRTVSAPVPRRSRSFATADVTGLTELLKTPAVAAKFGVLGENVQVEPALAVNVPESLAAIKAKLKEAETENTACRRRARELEIELERHKREIAVVRDAGVDNLREVVKEKTVLEDLISSTRAHISRLTLEIEQQRALADKLRHERVHALHHSPPRTNPTPESEIKALQFEVARLSQEIVRLHRIVEQSLETCKTARGEPVLHGAQAKPADAPTMAEKEAEEMPKRVRVNSKPEDIDDKEKKEAQTRTAKTPLPSRLKQGLRTVASQVDTLAPPTPRKPSASLSYKKQVAHHTETVLPSRLRQALFTTARTVDGLAPPTVEKAEVPPAEKDTKEMGQGGMGKASRQQPEAENRQSSAAQDATPPLAVKSAPMGSADLPEPSVEKGESSGPKPKTKLALVIRGLEEDFSRSKRHYAELADKYKRVDPASDPQRRQHLAGLLREAIDDVGKRADRLELLKGHSADA